MRSRDRIAVLALAILLAAVGVAMFATEGGQTPDPTPIYITPPPGLTYSEGVVGHPSSINPLTARTQVDRDLVGLLFRGLLRAGPNGSIVPDLASSWSASPDGLTYTFNLRNDARWEDGQPVTANDVVFTVTLAQDPDYDGPLGATWQGIKVAIVSPSVIRFTLPTPLGSFVRQAMLPILPEHLLADTAVTDLADSDYSGHPLGDGPFRITAIDDSHVLLVRSAGYKSGPVASGSVASGSVASGVDGPDASGGAASTSGSTGSGGPAGSVAATAVARPGIPGNIESVDLLFFDDQASALKSFESGRIQALGGLPPAAADTAATRAGSQLVRYPSASLYSVVLNQRATHPEMTNLNVRKALLAAIDRSTMVATVLRGRGFVADVPLPGWSPSYSVNSVVATAYDPASAQADLTAAGWVRGGSGWTLPAATSPYSIKLLSPDAATNQVAFALAGTIVKAWQAVGLNVTLNALSAADYGQALTDGTFDAAVVDYQLGLDPDVSPLLLSTQIAPAGANLSGVSDKTLDGLLMAVRTTSDPTARPAAVSALEKYVSANVLMLPICFADYSFAVSGKLKGIAPNDIGDPSGRYWDVLDWRLASDG
jgi:peptide/nickel transport system substrate-binding protein